MWLDCYKRVCTARLLGQMLLVVRPELVLLHLLPEARHEPVVDDGLIEVDSLEQLSVISRYPYRRYNHRSMILDKLLAVVSLEAELVC